MHTYRFCDDVWTFIVDHCTVRIDDDIMNTDKLKIVACNAKKASDISPATAVIP